MAKPTLNLLSGVEPDRGRQATRPGYRRGRRLAAGDRPGETFAIPAGHDAEVVGDQPCVSVDFGEIGDYAKPTS